MKQLELLLTTPSKYEINYLSTSISHNQEAVLQVKVKDTNFRGKIVSIRLHCTNLDILLEAIFFHYKPFMRRYFFSDNIIYIRGIIEIQNGYTKIIQPKIIDEISSIKNIYKGLKQATKNKILGVSVEDLDKLDTKIPSKIIQSLLDIHHPSLEFANEFNHTKCFPADTLYALKYIEYFVYHQKLQKKRKDFQAIRSFDISEDDVSDFKSFLPFELTNDQSNTLEDIKQDLGSQIASKRIVVGDVGSGKTVLILASAYFAYQNNSRTILMAPTSVLANQIYDEAKKYLSHELNIVLYTNKNKPKDELSQYDFIIGTHALLYADLPDYELILVDEQHKFGTNQRASLDKMSQKKKKRAHYIQFSATPIPRTQALIESNLVDFSFLRQTPFTKDIDTNIITKKDFKELLAHIKSEISQNRQIIIVYPLVSESETIDYQSIEEARGYWEKNFEDVFVTYGKDKDKEDVLEKFKDNGNILISTTVIEVGISLPRLSTIVLVGAERLGFASLHQLRGRVSRNGLKGYCYLYTNNTQSKRLKEFSKTITGFEIAELDLKFRESGDILSGKEQSGLQFKWLRMSEDIEIVREVQNINPNNRYQKGGSTSHE